MEDLILDFTKDCQALGYSDRTVESYCGHVRYYLQRQTLNSFVTTDDLRPFLVHLRDDRKLAPPTINCYFASLRTFFLYLEEMKMINGSEILKFRKRYLRNYKKRHTPAKKQLISVEKMALLIENTTTLHDKTLILFLAKTGIRRNELITLDRSDVSLESNTVLLKPTPKRSNRLIYFDDECRAFLQAYLYSRKDKRDALFLSPSGDRISRNRVYDIVTQNAQRIGIHNPSGFCHEKFTPHCTRVWYTTWLRRSGMPKSFIQELRGDVRSEAIDIYDHISSDELKDAYMKYMPYLGLSLKV